MDPIPLLPQPSWRAKLVALKEKLRLQTPPRPIAMALLAVASFVGGAVLVSLLLHSEPARPAYADTVTFWVFETLFSWLQYAKIRHFD